MKHAEALILKFIMVAVILELVLMNLTRLTFGRILILSLVVTVAAYVIGDMLILRFTNNTVATIADIGLALLVVYLFNIIYVNAGISFLTALLSAVIIGIGEWVFHKFLARLLNFEKEKRIV